MAFIQDLQKKLMELYKDFPEEIDNVHIQLTPNSYNISTQEQNINVSTADIKKNHFTPYLLDLFNAEVDFDFGLYVETDLKKLLRYSENVNNPNGKRILAYSLIETRINQLQQTTMKKELQKQLGRYSSQNIARLKQISKRSYRLLQEVNEFPIKLTELVTPRWLYNLSKREFEVFLQKCNRMNNLEQNFAGAQD
ncbi:14088_t:CDS:1 [Dentiscutata erythropus]|uniref:14088_t:CDS:1 n=1 Tax=Dentiscutata erythropus TaxID=1348616 RepID=A0A9N9NHU6_9GLOM|nr:14088_t:CDS:1 [Dentiscutata erythropus]